MTKTASALAITSTLVLGWLALTVPRQMERIETMLEKKTGGTILRLSTEIEGKGVRAESETTAMPGESREDLAARALADLAEVVRQAKAGG